MLKGGLGVWMKVTNLGHGLPLVVLLLVALLRIRLEPSLAAAFVATGMTLMYWLGMSVGSHISRRQLPASHLARTTTQGDTLRRRIQLPDLCERGRDRGIL